MRPGTLAKVSLLKLGRTHAVSLQNLTSPYNADATMQAFSSLATGVAFVRGQQYADASAGTPSATVPMIDVIVGRPSLMAQTAIAHEQSRHQRSLRGGRWGGLTSFQAMLIALLIVALMVGGHAQKRADRARQAQGPAGEPDAQWLAQANEVTLGNGARLPLPADAEVMLLETASVDVERAMPTKLATLRCALASYEVYAGSPGWVDPALTGIDPARVLAALHARFDPGGSSGLSLRWVQQPAYEPDQRILSWAYRSAAAPVQWGGVLRLGRTTLLGLYWTSDRGDALDLHDTALRIVNGATLPADEQSACPLPDDRRAAEPLECWIVRGRPD